MLLRSITNGTFQTGGNPANLVSNIVNGPNGPISYTLGNGLQVNATYDALGRVNGKYLCGNSLQISCAGGTQVYGFANTWEGSHITQDCDTAVGQCASYGYDEFSRLSSTNIGNGQQTFSYVYDRYGNRSQQNAPQGGPAPSYSVNTSTNQITSFAYDAAGNLTSDGIHAYTYDAEGKILMVDAGSTAQYVFNALDQRVRVQTSASTYEYIYDYAGRRISTWNPSNNSGIEGRIYWGNQQLAYRAYEGTTYFDHQDFVGTERMRTDYTGAVSSTYSSLPWGDDYSPNENNPSGNAQDNAHYALLEHDTESGTEHAQFRQLSSTQGRWMSPDPYDGSYHFGNPQSFNRYSYVLDNPLGFSDPLGLDSETSVTIYDSAGNVLQILDNTSVDVGSDGNGVLQVTPVTSTGTVKGGAPSNPATSKFNSKKYNDCLQNAAGTLKAADALGAYGVGSFLFTVGSTAITTGVQRLYGTTATNLAETAAGQAPSASESTVTTMAEKALFGEGTAALIGKVSGYVTVGATAVSLGIRAYCAAQAY